MNKTEREDAWGPVHRFWNRQCFTLSTPVPPPTHVFAATSMSATSGVGTHASALQACRSTFVDPRTQFVHPKVSQRPATTAHSLQPPIRLTGLIQRHRQYSPLVPRPSHSNEYPARQQQQGMGTFDDSRLKNMTCVRVPLQLPVVPGCVGVVSCIGDWECAHTRPGCKCQYQLVWVLPSSFRCYALPLLRWLLQPSLKLPLLTTAPDSNNRPQVVYTTYELVRDVLKDPRIPAFHSAPAWPKKDIKRVVGKQAIIRSSDTTIVKFGLSCR